MEINLKEFRGPNTTSFIGKELGKSARKQLQLHKFDNDEEEYILSIPSDTTSFNPSFFLGFLYESYKKLGLEKFKSKYIFKIENEDPQIIKAIMNNIQDGIMNAENTKNYSTKSFLFK
jgi:hypothetical protein